MRNLMLRLTLFWAMMTPVISPALAGETASDYLDDRSSAEQIIASFYNAINRDEYLRAYSYFGADRAPQSYEQFKAGYESTAKVVLVTGETTSEGAAGSTYYTLPVAIAATDTNGAQQLYAGCYILRLVQPALQDAPPFMPLHIESGALQAAKGDLAALAHKPCPESR